MQENCCAGGLRTRGIPTTVKYGHHRERISAPFDADKLLSPIRRRLEYLYRPFLYDQQCMAGISFRKNRGTLFEVETTHISGDQSQFLLRQVGKER